MFVQFAAMLHVLVPGLLTTVQDLGRWGWQQLGVPVSGPMDVWSHRRANALVGNTPNAGALEVTIVGPELRFERPGRFAVCGALFELELDGRRVEVERAHEAGAGSVLAFRARQRGARAYLAIAGGVDVPVVLGSRSTHLASQLGGLEGRALRAGDRLPLGVPSQNGTGYLFEGEAGYAPSADKMPSGGARLRVLPGPHDAWLTDEAREALVGGRYMVSPVSNRMGYRLAGPRLACREETLLSTATIPGAIQVPPSGDPLLLMADRQTTGGYPMVAAVIAADQGLAGQLAPGDWVEFAWCDEEDALGTLAARERACTS